MTPKKAAEIIGCSPQQVRTLIRVGKLRAVKVSLGVGGTGREFYQYEVHRGDVKRYAKSKQKVGYPRGRKRS